MNWVDFILGGVVLFWVITLFSAAQFSVKYVLKSSNKVADLLGFLILWSALATGAYLIGGVVHDAL